ncbi:MAG: hypothetical protein ACRDLV_04320 [Solirubrobacteraceae bacterium]
MRLRVAAPGVALRVAIAGIALLAGIPIIVATVRAVIDGWTPYGDRAVIALRSFDVFGPHSPAVGQYTQWSAVLGKPIFSPGPLLYWLLAIPARLGATALPIWIALVNLGCVLALLALARRRGGLPLVAATALLLPLMLRSLPSETFHDIWNPSTTLLPFLLTCFVAWSVAIGELALAPALVLLLSFIVQTHSTFVVPGLGLLAVTVVALAIAARDRVRRRNWGSRWLWGSVAVAVVCWAVPLGDQLAGSGNLRALVDASRAAQGHLGIAAGWHAIVRAFGIPPWWLGPSIGTPRRIMDVAVAPGWASQAACGLMLAVLVGFLVAGLRRRQLQVAVPAAAALALVVSLGIVTALTPTEDDLQLTIAYTLWWASPAGLFVWLVTGRLAARQLARMGGARARSGLSAVRNRGRLPAFGDRGGARPAVAVAAATAIIAVLVAAGQPADVDRGDYRPFRSAAKAVTAAVGHARSITIDAQPLFPASELAYELAYALKRDGVSVMVPPAVAAELGRSYVSHAQGGVRLEVTYGGRMGSPGSVLATVRVHRPAFPPGVFRVTLVAPDDG